MRLGISALLFNLDKALELCREVDRINHIEVGIDNFCLLYTSPSPRDA